MSNANLAKHEARMTAAIAKRAIVLGYVVQVSSDGEVEQPAQTPEAITTAATALDEARLLLFKAQAFAGFIYLVYGNSPQELVCDYTDSEAIRAVLGNAIEE